MKKTFSFLIGLVVVLNLSAQKKVVQYEDQDKDKWSKMSIGLEVGANKFDGDAENLYNAVIPSSFAKASVGVTLEQNLTPSWSMGMQYYYLPMEGGGRKMELDANKNLIKGYHFYTQMHNLDVFMGFNLSKHFFKYSQSKWNMWATLGLGGALYAVDYKTDGRSIPNNNGVPDQNEKFNDGRALYFPVGVLFEYNITKAFALGGKIQYRFYGADNLEGRNYRGVSSDNVSMTSLSLRYKLKAYTKDHLRNVNVATFENKLDNGLNNKINQLEQRINGIVIPELPIDEINDLDGRLRKLENYLDVDGDDDDNDGVANSRDLEPNTPAGNQVDFWGRTIPKRGSSSSVTNVYNTATNNVEEAAYIFFDFDKTDLDKTALEAIRIAADKLIADSELLLEVRGYTDNVGSNKYNEKLSQLRSERVKNELVKVYGIDANRIIANGKGKNAPDALKTPYRPYRTAVLYFSK